MEIRLTCSLGPTFLLGFLKLYLLNVSLQSFSFFFIASKAFSKLDIGEDFKKEKEKEIREGKGRPF
jgi:hypothetical protein